MGPINAYLFETQRVLMEMPERQIKQVVSMLLRHGGAANRFSSLGTAAVLLPPLTWQTTSPKRRSLPASRE
jgi:hypothetical protein